MDADSLLDELWEVAGPEGGAGEQEADSASSGAGRGAAEPQLDYDLAPSQVAARIESCALWVAEHLAAGRLPDLDLPAAPPAPPQARSLAGRHPESADRYSRLWAVLAACHQGLVAGARATQRELHYRLKPLDVFTQPGHAAEAVQDACALLRVPRSALGVTTSSKGLVAGRLRIRDRATGAVTQCWGPGAEGGRPIGGDLDAIACMELDACDAAAVLVVEKDAVFQQLVAEDFHIRHLPAILVTGKGVPDLPTRAFLAQLHAAAPALPLLALVDWNPSGVGILSLYKNGSRRMPESARHRLPTLRWLGARAGMLRAASGADFQPLTPRDRALVTSLGAALRGPDPAWAAELEAMEAAGAKAEMEAAYSGCGGAAGFGAAVAEMARRGDWV